MKPCKLVKFGNKNILDMHDLLRDMGREIIRKQSPEEPEKRTRLWLNDDVLNVLENNIVRMLLINFIAQFSHLLTFLNLNLNTCLFIMHYALIEFSSLCIMHSLSY